MRVKDIMCGQPACCTPYNRLDQVAMMMIENDCGAIPVVDTRETMRPLGIITDRDIACRVVAQGRNPLEVTANECMSKPVITVTADSKAEDCCRTMEKHQIRRMVVVDDAGRCCGIVSQADVALHGSKGEAGELVREVSRSTQEPSRM